ncbi:MAG: tRNA (adenosine(37)-N6)-threonylcarbamoyltransferase complex ATPase subunit type 1 TsaE [Thermoleophilia bacterium]|nr:tRNA (adenosine(37)-N6)-threonylcarbamoyltransferase complex ATPase subunit type 1 TsaE [Thermoleophilia bacterium]
MALEILSRSEEQTAALAASLAKLLEPGDIIFLSGQLGVGKTFFIRHAAEALGISEPVTSPSFTMAQTYDAGHFRVHHLDLYRLSGFSADDAVDFEEYFENDAVTFVEWPERAKPYIEGPDVVIRIDHVDLSSRRISIESSNARIASGLEERHAGSGD